jgi:hypothetical protein
MPKAKEKSKQLSPHRLGTLMFVGLWILPQVAGWVTVGAVWELFRDIFINNEFFNALLATVMPGMIAAVAHRWLIERDTGKAMRGWLRVNLLGWFASSLIFYQLYLTNNVNESLPIMFATLFLPAALAQGWWLHQRVHNAWLWVVATIASAFVFTLPAQITSSDAPTLLVGLGLAGLLQGSLMGIAMRHLWSSPREKDKRDQASLDETSDLAAVDRLTDAPAELHLQTMPYLAEEQLAAAGQRQVKP